MNRNVIIALLILITITGCSSDRATNKTAEKSSAAAPAVAFKGDGGAKMVYDHYIDLKNALVKSDSKEASNSAGELKSALESSGSTKGVELAGKIAGSEDLKVQRAEFDALTAEAEKIIRKQEIASGKIYKQYCPMANEGNGGYWLAGEPEIRNPYYGDEMLECGNVKEEIQ